MLRTPPPARRRIKALGIPLLALLALAALPRPQSAQILKKVKRTVAGAAEAETLRQLDQLVRGKVRCVFDDLTCIKNAEASEEGVVLTDDEGEILVDEDGNPISDPEKGAAVAQGRQVRPGAGAWANYDFVPGDEILIYEDFGRDEVGDFPRRFGLIQGNWEIVEWQGGRYLQATSGGLLAIPLPDTLPERFTIEVPVTFAHGNAYVRLMPGRAYYGRDRRYGGSVVSLELARAGVRPAGNQGPTVMSQVEEDRRPNAGVVPLRVMGDGEYLKVYLGERRVANVPNAVFPRADSLFIAVAGGEERRPVLLGPIRIAGGGRDLYNRLAEEGRVATQGILFATNSDRIRPESTPTLEEIGKMLRDYPELRIGIEGHTDGDGEEAYNQQLSERRAAAVEAFLVEEYGIREDRLQTAGFGESRPVADNSSPEGKQQNRRVELVRLSP